MWCTMKPLYLGNCATFKFSPDNSFLFINLIPQKLVLPSHMHKIKLKKKKKNFPWVVKSKQYVSELKLLVSHQYTLAWMCVNSLITWIYATFSKGHQAESAQNLENAQWMSKAKNQLSKRHYYPKTKLKIFWPLVQIWCKRNWFSPDRSEVDEYLRVTSRYPKLCIWNGFHFDWKNPVFLNNFFFNFLPVL